MQKTLCHPTGGFFLEATLLQPSQSLYIWKTQPHPMKTAWTYILECADGSYYTGATSNIGRRLWQHHSGTHTKAYTYKRRPLRLAYWSEHKCLLKALLHEKKIKRLSKAHKKALVDLHENQLKHLKISNLATK
ncbi:MAG: GIY-YIG nuclease family protein [Flavobacteriaceae bacterium]